MGRTYSARPFRLWAPAVAWGVAAWALHRIGAANGLYITFGWFQNLTHAASASAMALLLAVAAFHLGYRGRGLVAFVVVFSLVGAVSWEIVEYFGLLDAYGIWLHFHSFHDAAIDMSANAVGVTATLLVLWTRTGLDGPTWAQPDS